MKVAYTGLSDFQEFSAEDFKKAELDQKKLSFARGEAVEVSDEVGQALTSKEGIFGDFSFKEVEDEKPETDEQDEEDDDADEDAPSPAPNSGRKARAQGAARTTPRSTGAGSSTP